MLFGCLYLIKVFLYVYYNQYMPLEDFQITGDLGKGSFGSVHKCIRRSDGEVYAMKQIKLQKLKQKDKANALNQIRFLASVQSPFIVDYKQAFYDQPSEKLCIVMSCANGGDLQAKIKKAQLNKTRISQEEIWKVAYQCLQGLLKLHDSSIIHRDIKPANIFFHNGVAQIGDLNVAKHLKDPFTVTQTGTPYYASPEVWSEEPYNYKSDIWSLGCVLYEMAVLKPPFRAETPDKLYKKIMIGQYEKVSTPYSRQLSKFISTLMTHSQKKRPQIKQILCHPKMMDMKSSDLNQGCQDDRMLKTITFPKNINNLNEQLPKPKYAMKSKTTKLIQIDSETDIKKGPSCVTSKKIPLSGMTSMKMLPINEAPSQKLIGEPQTPLNKYMSIKELIAARRPKALIKCGSQKLIF